MIAITMLALTIAGHSPGATAPAPIAPIPSQRQLAWHDREYYAFVHFGPNTFTGNEWGHGTEQPDIFNPTNLDCRQWVRTFKAAGMKAVIITAKHHDGFCLWPSKYSTHTVAQSKWKNGKGDVLKVLSEACKEYGLKMGVYLSPWDRNHPTYGTPEYNNTFKHMLHEVLTNYGPMCEVWFDGANGEGPNGKKQVYDWPGFVGVVRECQPNAVIFSDMGPDIRWVGNESGFAGETNWGFIPSGRYLPGKVDHPEELTVGTKDGDLYVPAECDVSIRPGWFYRSSEDSKVKSLDDLLKIYYSSVGRNGNLLLNVPADTDGQIHATDVKRLTEFKKALDDTFSQDFAKGAKVEATSFRGQGFEPQNVADGKAGSYWAAEDGMTSADLTLTFKKPTDFDVVSLQEYLPLGQRVSSFSLEAKVDGEWKEIGSGTTIGHKRLLQVTPVETTAMRVRIKDARACPTLSHVGVYASAKVQKQTEDSRMNWWKAARFGMFIHWGVYSVPAGEWNGKTGYAEWIREEAHIPVETYEKFRDQFNPTKFNAETWVKAAKDAGMKYITITTKHHDGFCLFDSKYTDWDIMHTPYHKDIMKMMADACRKYGMKMCWYHSIMDWHEPDYLPRRSWEDRPIGDANMDRYVQHLHDQVTELLTNYGDIGVMWFDGQWESTWNDKYGQSLYDLCRKLQPNVIVNNRVGSDGKIGDFSTPEQFIPATGLPGVNWETCMTMNDHWGYNKNDRDWKSSQMLIRNLIDVASKGGNYLLNIGPMSTGEFPPEAIERLHDIGAWMKVNGDAIHGTTASVFDSLPWGRCTVRAGKSSSKIYLHVFDWPSNGKLVVPGLGNEPQGATLLAGNKKLNISRQGSDLIIDLPSKAPDSVSSTICVAVKGAPIVYRAPKFESAAAILVDSATVAINSGSSELEVRFTVDGTEPDGRSEIYVKPLTLRETTTIRAASFHHGQKVSTTSVYTVTKVEPKPAQTVSEAKPMLWMREFKGSWETMPDFSKLKAVKAQAAPIGIAETAGKADENVGRWYSGYINVPADGVYVFALASDDGSTLRIDSEDVVDNDGLHSPETKTGQIALAKGFHRIGLRWFNASGGAQLSLSWGLAGQKLEPLADSSCLHIDG